LAQHVLQDAAVVGETMRLRGIAARIGERRSRCERPGFRPIRRR